MYPFARMLKELWVSRNLPDLPLTGTHVSHHMCWPWDIDMWMELNNGRTLTLFDLGRIPLARRVGLIGVLREKKWGLTMAGCTVRYRRRVKMFDRVTMHSRAVYWDDRFIYMEQAMFKTDGECSGHVLYRTAVVGQGGMVPPAEVLAALGRDDPAPDAPDWVAAWIEADALRPWPPMAEERDQSVKLDRRA